MRSVSAANESLRIDVEWSRRFEPGGDAAVVAHHADRQLGAPDVDRNDVGHRGGG